MKKMRKDGKLLKNVDPMYSLAAYFMQERYDAQNMITVKVPYDPIHDYVLEARKKGHKLSHLSVVTAAMIRGIAEYPKLNRFVVHNRIYARNELTVGMVVLRPGDDADPSMSKMKFDLYDTVFDVNDKMTSYIEENNKATSNNDSDKLFRKLVGLSFLVRPLMALFRFLDRHGILPKKIIDLSPFHNTFTITNLASIRTNHIYHHVYGFGTTSMLVSMGVNVEEPYQDGDQVKLKKMIPLGIVMDERIASGCYYAHAFDGISKYLKNPELLELPPENVKVDYEFEGLSEHFKKEKKSK